MFVASAAAIAAIVFFTVSILGKQAKPIVKREEIQELWKAMDYQQVKELTHNALEADPLNSFFLSMNGFASFYLALSESDSAQKASKMDEAIFSIRKAMLDDKAVLKPESFYILGKAYYFKGPEYYHDCIENLEESIKLGYIRPDSWEYLAIANLSIKQYENSIFYFEKALEIKPDSAELLLNAALVYKILDKPERTKELALAAKALAADDFIMERCDFVLAEIYMQSGKTEDAISLYEDIIARNPESADGWYYQGLALMEKGEALKARAAWRKAISIDPMHSGARQKLLERS